MIQWSGIIQNMGSANERRCYIVMAPLIGWAHTQNDPILYIQLFIQGMFSLDQPSYRQVSNIRRTKSQNINVSCLVLQLSLPNPLKPCVKLRMKM